MIIIAASLYLPEHVSTIMRRASFYWAGDEDAAATAAGVRTLVKASQFGYEIPAAAVGDDVLDRLAML